MTSIGRGEIEGVGLGAELTAEREVEAGAEDLGWWVQLGPYCLVLDVGK